MKPPGISARSGRNCSAATKTSAPASEIRVVVGFARIDVFNRFAGARHPEDSGSLGEAGDGRASIPGARASRVVCAVRTWTKRFAISGAIFGELARILSGVMLGEL